MQFPEFILKRKSALNRLLIAVFSISIFIFSANASFRTDYLREEVYAGVKWKEDQRKAVSIFKYSPAQAYSRRDPFSRYLQYCSLNAISLQLDNAFQTAFTQIPKLLPSIPFHSVIQIRNSTASSEDTFPSFF